MKATFPTILSSFSKTERPLCFTSYLVLGLAMLITTGVLTPQKALAGFGSPALITLMGLFVVSAALFRSGALDRLRELSSQLYKRFY